MFLAGCGADSYTHLIMSAARQPSLGDVTGILERLNEGEKSAWNELLPLTYRHLREIARGKLARDGSSSVQPTEIVHETWLRLWRHESIRWVDRNHFFGVAAHLIRLILIDRGRAAGRRQNLHRAVALNMRIESEGSSWRVDLLGHALDRLAEIDQRQAQIVEMKFFSGMTIEQIAGFLDTSPRTVKREWTSARAFLRAEMDRGRDGQP